MNSLYKFYLSGNEITHINHIKENHLKLLFLYSSKKVLFLLLIIIFSMLLSKENVTTLKIKNISLNNFFTNSTVTINYDNDNQTKNLHFNFSYHEHSYSLKYNIIEIVYYIKIIDDNNNLIKPFDLSFYYNFHLFCYLKLIEENVEIQSLPHFYRNKYLICIIH